MEFWSAVHGRAAPPPSLWLLTKKPPVQSSHLDPAWGFSPSEALEAYQG